MAAVDDVGEGAAEGWGEDAELIIDEGNKYQYYFDNQPHKVYLEIENAHFI